VKRTTTIPREEQDGYLCPSPEVAQHIVGRVLEAAGDASEAQAAKQNQVLKDLVFELGCTSAEGDFKVFDAHDDVYIARRQYVGDEWRALTALDAAGRRVGLLIQAP
jgi:hypothetical protein